MAATDQHYRSQKTLDVVFAGSCLVMLVSIVGMFAQDYFRPYKVEARTFRDVEEALAARAALAQVPDAATITAAEEKVRAARAELESGSLKSDYAAAQAEVYKLKPQLASAEAAYQMAKADYDSVMSLYNIAVEHAGTEGKEAQELRKQVDDLYTRINQDNKGKPALLPHYQDVQTQLEEAQKKVTSLEKARDEAVAELKKLNADFDRAVKNAVQKQWGFRDTFRGLPVVDAFATSTKINQFTLEDLPIEYGSFKRVTRYDRCTTCHLGIDRPGYELEAIAALKEQTEGLRGKVADARAMLESRAKLLAGTSDELTYKYGDLRLPTVKLTPAQEKEFCAHPRLDLYVGENSPHPAEKFGCTSCHSGQGSATEFKLAAHSPNDAAQKKEWQKSHGWASSHYWDFPMLPKRFTESTCLKCHYQVTDLIRDGNRVEAPKLVRGYNLVRDNGCFGCHEISGVKAFNNVPRFVGPDLRLEPPVPLSDLSPADRARATADPLAPPGTMRKVGPSLKRLSEKTNEEWTRKWVNAPRGFRPDTKMPHFYGLANNSDEALKGTGQEKFPAAEIHAVTHYLFKSSADHVAKAGALPRPNLPNTYKEDKAKGQRLFTERGCLACHSHHGTETGANPVKGEALFGPNLTRVAAKLGTRPGDKASAQLWLVNWIKNPMLHHPRTAMPVTHLTDDEASDVAAWLLDQKADAEWDAVKDVEAPKLEDYKALARVWLEKVGTKSGVKDLLDPANPEASARATEWLKGLREGADEKVFEKGGVTEDSLKMYVGRKGVNQMGCYACHDIPGFENAKPIGTPLNDWGKKDAERLAFEDVGAYVQRHYYEAEKLTGEDGQPMPVRAEGTGKKLPYESFFLEMLEHHQREGFLYQKLREPRSYDYQRIRTWDERLRMPQFRFARTEKKEGESDDAYEARREKEEAEAREAVMTFILGLVAEPVPAKYVYNPSPEKMAEVKGRQVLDKFNCAGCHHIRPGVYEFDLRNPETLKQLESAHQSEVTSPRAADDHVYQEHAAWTGQPRTRADGKLSVFAMTRVQDELKLLRLTDAVRFTGADKKPRDIPAAGQLIVGEGAIDPKLVTEVAAPYGGTLANLLSPYLNKKDAQTYGDESKQRQALPPPLLRQGEKTQPGWLFQFLRNPYAIRPITVLRMPKFNLSDEDAQALVNYFAAVDKMQNPGIGLNYPYLAVPQREDGYLAEKSRQYVAKLKAAKPDGKKSLFDQRVEELLPVWERQLQEQTLDLEARVTAATAADKAAKPDTKLAADKALADLQKELNNLKGADGKQQALQAQQQQWEQKDAYMADAYRLLGNPKNPCMSCHQVGGLGGQQQGPPLHLLTERLRPDWTERWVASPDRMLSYPTPMPQNFPKTKPGQYADFAGTPQEQVEALRDVLLNFPKAAEMPVNRYYRPAPGEGGK